MDFLLVFSLIRGHVGSHVDRVFGRQALLDDWLEDWLDLRPTEADVCWYAHWWNEDQFNFGMRISLILFIISFLKFLILWSLFSRLVNLCSQFTWFSVNTPAQEAVAQSLEHALSGTYFQDHVREYTERRGVCMKMLQQSGYQPILPQSMLLRLKLNFVSYEWFFVMDFDVFEYSHL